MSVLLISLKQNVTRNIHSSNLVVNHPVGRKVEWCLASGGQSVCPRGPGDVATDPASGLWPSPQCTQCTPLAVQQPIDILRSGSAPLTQRYRDLSGSDI